MKPSSETIHILDEMLRLIDVLIANRIRLSPDSRNDFIARLDEARSGTADKVPRWTT